MKKLFFILILAVTTNSMALPDNPQSKSTSEEYKYSDANLTSFIFNEIKSKEEQPGDINYIYEQYKLTTRQFWKQSKTKEEFTIFDDKLYADYLNEAYRQSQSEDDKKDLEKHLQTIKTVYKLTYKPAPIKDQFAKINLAQKTYVVNGIAYDINDRAIVTTPLEKPKLSAKTTSSDVTTKKTVVEKKKPVITVGPLSEPKFLPDPAPFASCVWDTKNPRTLVYGPGCSADGSCLCRGHVICKRNGHQKRRLATCSEKYCTDETPSECSAELGFGSQIPQK
jgi:hypothetical protein